MMKRLHNNELMDYLDGTLTPAHLAKVEAHLAACPEDAELVAELKMAQQALLDWDASEPVQASADFWPKLRDQLPAAPKRSPLHAFGTQLKAWLWPAQSQMGMGLRVAMLAALLAIAAALMTPQQARHQVVATPNKVELPAKIGSDEQRFQQRSQLRPSSKVAPGAVQGDASNTDAINDVEDDAPQP